MSVDPTAVKAAQEKLEAHLREIIQWHFSPETGCPYWLDWAKKNFDPRKGVNSFADLIARFPHFQDETLRDLQPEVWKGPSDSCNWGRAIPRPPPRPC